MTKSNTLDIALQSSLLKIGRVLSLRQTRQNGHTEAATTNALDAEITRVLSVIRGSATRRLLGIHATRTSTQDAVRLKAFSYVAWQMVAEVTPATCIEILASAIADPMRPICEQLLIGRHILGIMAGEGVLTFCSAGNGWSGRFLLPRKVFSWVIGGAQSHGDFDPAKMHSAHPAKGDEDDGDAGPKVVPTAKEIYDRVRQSGVIGLDPQVRVLASRIALHIARAELLQSGNQEHAIGNTVILLIGSSGSGKSFLVERMAMVCGLPYSQVDSTTLTASGYVGSDTDSVFTALVGCTNGSVKEASRGIVFLDEFDKKSTRYGRDVGGEAVQMELLTKLHCTAPFLVGGKRSFDTRPFLFDGRPTAYCLAGVFSGLDKIIEKQTGRRDIGFACNTVGKRHHIRIADCLKQMGFLDELINRISCIVRLPDPTFESVMQATTCGILDGINRVLFTRGITILPTEEAVRTIARYAVETRGYFRTAKSVLAVVAEEALFDERDGYVAVEADDAKRIIDRLGSGIIQPSVESATATDENAIASGGADVQAGESAGA